jgi:hypothetical protein
MPGHCVGIAGLVLAANGVGNNAETTRVGDGFSERISLELPHLSSLMIVRRGADFTRSVHPEG